MKTSKVRQESGRKHTNRHSKREKAKKLCNDKQYKTARKILCQLRDKGDLDVESLYLLGLTHNRVADYQNAVNCLNQIISVNPYAAAPHYELGISYKNLGIPEIAEESLKKAIELNNNYFEAYLELAEVLIQTNKWNKAVECIKTANKINPHSAEPHARLGRIYQLLGQNNLAIKEYYQALELHPRMADAQAGLGKCLYRIGKLDKATEHLNKAVRIQPNMIEAWLNLGKVCTLRGDLTKGENAYNKILKKNPNNLDAVAGKAGILRIRRQIMDTYRLILPHIEENTLHGELGHIFALICKKVGACEQAIKYLEKICDNNAPRITDQDRLLAHFDLGKLYDRSKSYSNAYKHFKLANDMSDYRYDAVGHAAVTDRLINANSRENLLQVRHPTFNTSRPIFIIGMPRSGTTLVEQILSRHPLIHGAGELTYLGDIGKEIQERYKEYPHCLFNLTQEEIDSYSAEYLKKTTNLNPKAVYIVDKMPHNFTHLALIDILLPDSKIIHCVRDPADTCLSIYFQGFNLSHNYSTDLNALGMHYRQYARLMLHWKQALSIPIYDIHYENIVNDTEDQTRKLLEFCGLDWDPTCLDFYTSDRFVNTASEQQVTQPIYSTSIGRWRKYENHIQPLLHTLGYHNKTQATE